MTERATAFYRTASLAAAAVFAAVGLCFLLIPGRVLLFFNGVSRPLGFPPAPSSVSPFFIALAAAYMYVVTVLAFGMYRHPESRIYPSLLAQAKFASALLSLILFFAAGRCLILLANGIVDGLIGLAVVALAARGRPKDA